MMMVFPPQVTALVWPGRMLRSSTIWVGLQPAPAESLWSSRNSLIVCCIMGWCWWCTVTQRPGPRMRTLIKCVNILNTGADFHLDSSTSYRDHQLLLYWFIKIGICQKVTISILFNWNVYWQVFSFYSWKTRRSSLVLFVLWGKLILKALRQKDEEELTDELT